MVLCLFVGCHARSGRDKSKSFFRIPSVRKDQGEIVEELTIERRRRWLSAISREGLTEEILQNDRVCCRHFVSGRPAADWDKFNIDWVPTLHLGHKKSVPKDTESMVARTERSKARQKRKNEQALAESAAKLQAIDVDGERIRNIDFHEEEENQLSEVVEQQEQQQNIESLELDFEELSLYSDRGTQTENKTSKDSENQTEEFDYMFAKSNDLVFDRKDMQDDKKVRFYTGLVSFQVLVCLYDHVAPYVSRQSKSLTQFQVLVMILMKLRINMPFQDLAYRFGVYLSTVSRLFSSWIPIMAIRLRPMIYWPERDQLWATMPQCFQYSFGNKTTVIIDCFEVFIERPTNLYARAQTYSSYKSHNTIKILIGITPQGTICFTSDAWGGRTSDKFLTENCGFLNKLVPGDLVMADRGFTIDECLALKRAQLAIPTFTKGKSQLDPIDVEKTRGIANVRIHVERVIGLLRRKYTILEGILPTDFLMSSQQGKVPLTDHIITVCSALVNLCPSIVPFD